MPTAVLKLRVSPRATVLELDEGIYLRLDAEGRWTTYGERGAVFRRTLDGGIVFPAGGRVRRLTDAESEAVHARVGRRAGELLDLLGSGVADVSAIGDAREAHARLEAASCWTRARRQRHRDAYAAAYPEPAPILPPHRYRDLVLLPATGCPNHRCAFCAFYRDRPFRMLDDAAFDAHLQAVRSLFGHAIAERDGVFLGSASALTLPDAVLRRRLDAIVETFGPPRRGIAAFYDADRGALRAPAAWAALGERGLVEATLGLETGWGALRERVGKSADLERFQRVVGALKAAGLDVALTVLLGLGDEEDEEAEHRARTVAFLLALPLTEADRIYLSPLQGDAVAPGGSEAEGTWRDALAGRTPARVGTYRIDRFAFLA